MAINFVLIGKRIGEIRKHRGISQQRLAEIIEKSPTYISYIENGLKCMSLDTFVSIANALHVSADELLKDSIDNTIKVFNHDFANLISDCNEYEKRVLLELSLTAKKAMRDNRHLLSEGHSKAFSHH